MFKKAQMMSMRKILSLVLGLLVLAFGAIPLLHQFGVIGFTIPDVPALVLWILCVVIGILLVIDGFAENLGMSQALMWVSIFFGILVLALGVIPILASIGIIGFTLPGFLMIALNFVFVISGILLIIGGFSGF